MTQQPKNTVPQIRFQGFSHEWDEMRMGELLWFKNGYNAGKEQYGTGKKFINVLDIMENDYITHDRIIGRVDIPDDDFKNNEVTYGDILFQRSSETREEVGQANVYLDEHTSATFGGFVIRGKPLAEFDPVFFNVMLKSAKVRREITSRSGGSTRYNVGQESLEEALVAITPDSAEQQKIAAFWMSLDRTSGLHQRKHDKLVTLKKAMLQKMFPQDGATTPEIRFKGFNETWQRCELGAITGKIGSGKTPKGGKSVYVSNGIPLLRSQNIVNDIVDFDGIVFISDEIDEEMSNSRVSKDDVLLNITGASIGRSAVYRTSEPANVNQHVCIIRANEGYDSDFIQLNLTSSRGQKAIDSSQAGGGREGLNFQQIGKIGFQFPSIPEQTLIGTYFRKLGELTSKHATQLEKLKNIKSACLEKMFV